MPPKRNRKSRLNSTSTTDHSKLRSTTANKTLLKLEEQSSEDHSKDCETLDYTDEIETEEASIDSNQAMSRTTLLILDYRQFKAARCIQRFVRGWLARSLYRRKRKASIIIQTEWRRFYACRLYYRILEQIVQQRLEEHYFKAARTIQAFWRGWWVREHIHDHTRLMRLQLMAGEDLLHCIAFKLHHLLRTHQIPGIYSLRNSKVLSKVETLLASMTFKTCTRRIQRAHDFRQQQTEQARKQFQNSLHGTRLPYPGPNFQNACMPKCMSVYNEKDADRKMNKILRMYEEANRKDSSLRERKPKSKCPRKCTGDGKPTATTFCGDVVHSMKKWKIITENNIKVDPNVFQHPENLENFLKDIKSWWSLIHDNCYCSHDYINQMGNRELTSSKRKSK